MTLKSRVEALENAKTDKPLLVVWKTRGETVEDAAKREGIDPDNATLLIVKYDETPLELPTNA